MSSPSREQIQDQLIPLPQSPRLDQKSIDAEPSPEEDEVDLNPDEPSMQKHRRRKSKKKVPEQSSINQNIRRLHEVISKSRSRSKIPESYQKVTSQLQSAEILSGKSNTKEQSSKKSGISKDKENLCTPSAIGHEGLRSIGRKVKNSFKRPESKMSSKPQSNMTNNLIVKKEALGGDIFKVHRDSSIVPSVQITPSEILREREEAREKNEAREMNPLFDQVQAEGMKLRARSMSPLNNGVRIELPERFQGIRFPEFLDYGPLPQRKLGRKSKADKIIDKRVKEKEVVGFTAGDFDTMTDYEILAGIKMRKFEELQDQQKKGGFTFETAINALLSSLIYKLKPLNGEYNCYCNKPTCQRSYATVNHG
jgi:hypothetical protein